MCNEYVSSKSFRFRTKRRTTGEENRPRKRLPSIDFSGRTGILIKTNVLDRINPKPPPDRFPLWSDRNGVSRDLGRSRRRVGTNPAAKSYALANFRRGPAVTTCPFNSATPTNLTCPPRPYSFIPGTRTPFCTRHMATDSVVHRRRTGCGARCEFPSGPLLDVLTARVCFRRFVYAAYMHTHDPWATLFNVRDAIGVHHSGTGLEDKVESILPPPPPEGDRERDKHACRHSSTFCASRRVRILTVFANVPTGSPKNRIRLPAPINHRRTTHVQSVQREIYARSVLHDLKRCVRIRIRGKRYVSHKPSRATRRMNVNVSSQ